MDGEGVGESMMVATAETHDTLKDQDTETGTGSKVGF